MTSSPGQTSSRSTLATADPISESERTSATPEGWRPTAGLAAQLARRELLSGNRNSLVGYGWFILDPLLNVATFSAVRAMRGVSFPEDLGVSYFEYLVLGIFAWSVFNTPYMLTKQSLVQSRGMLGMVRFPWWALVLKQQIVALVILTVSGAVTLALLMALGFAPTATFLLIAFLLAPGYLFGFAAGLLMSVVAVIFPDVDRIFTVVVRVLFFLTPIIYRAEDVTGFVGRIVGISPLTALIARPRDTLLGLEPGSSSGLAFFWAVAALLLALFAARVFEVSRRIVLERVL